METAGPHKRDPARRPPRAPVAVSMTPGAGEPGVAQRPARPACGTRRHDGSGSKGAMDFQKSAALTWGRSIIKKSAPPACAAGSSAWAARPGTDARTQPADPMGRRSLSVGPGLYAPLWSPQVRVCGDVARRRPHAPWCAGRS